MKKEEIRKELERRESERRSSERRELDRVLIEKEVEGKIELAKTLAQIGETLKHLHTGQKELRITQKEFSNVFDKHAIVDNKRYTDVMIEMNYQRGQSKYWYMIISILGVLVVISSVIATIFTLR